MQIRDLMQTKVLFLSADDTLWTVKEIMELGSVRHLPVVSGGVLVGVVSQRDMLHASLSNVIGIGAEEQRLFLEGVKISEVMSKPPIAARPADSVQAAASSMASHKIGCLPVVEDGKLLGIVTETDLLHYFADSPPR